MITLDYNLKDIVRLSTHPVTVLRLSNFHDWFLSLCTASEQDVYTMVYNNEDSIRKYAYLFKWMKGVDGLQDSKLYPLYDMVENQITINECIKNEDVTSIPLAIERCYKWNSVKPKKDCLVTKLNTLLKSPSRSDTNQSLLVIQQFSYEERIEILQYSMLQHINVEFLLPLSLSVGPLYLSDIMPLNLASCNETITIRHDDLPLVTDHLFMRFYHLELEEQEDIFNIPLKNVNILGQLMQNIHDFPLLARLRNHVTQSGDKQLVKDIEKRFIEEHKRSQDFTLWPACFSWFDKVNQSLPLTKEEMNYRTALCYYIKIKFAKEIETAKNLGLMTGSERDVLQYYKDLTSQQSEISLVI